MFTGLVMPFVGMVGEGLGAVWAELGRITRGKVFAYGKSARGVPSLYGGPAL